MANKKTIFEKSGKIIMVSSVVLVDDDNNILLGKRPEGKPMSGFFEFPGGKMRMNENPVDCAIREIKEELKIIIKKSDLMPINFFIHDYDDFSVIIFLFVCGKWTKEIENHHYKEIKWQSLETIESLNILEANRKMIKYIKKMLEL